MSVTPLIFESIIPLYSPKVLQLQYSITKIVKLEEQKRKVEEETIDVEGVIEVLSKADKVFPLLDKEAQKRLIRKLIKKIEVENKCIKEIHFNFEQSFRIKCDKQSRIISK